jgi:hypothetical protein
MKRKETSKLLNEWKSFLNESQLDTDALENFDDANALNTTYEEAREADEDKEAIFSALSEMGLDEKNISDILNMLSGMKSSSIAELAEEFDEQAFGSREELEKDTHLSER